MCKGITTELNTHIIYLIYINNYEARQIHNSDLIDVIINIDECKNNIAYLIWIGRQYPKSFICNKKQNYYIEKPPDFNWIYTEYEYIRK